MKTVFDKQTRDQLISRINLINESKTPQWGKMTPYQMVKHCSLSEELYLGNKKYKRVLLGRIFGKIALKNILKEGAPFPRNAKTKQDFLVTGNGNLEAEKTKLISLLHEYETFSLPFVEHWFFGKMSKDQLGALSYKHLDHHLQQFGC